MYCPKCGKPVDDDALFCSSCGHALKKENEKKSDLEEIDEKLVSATNEVFEKVEKEANDTYEEIKDKVEEVSDKVKEKKDKISFEDIKKKIKEFDYYTLLEKDIIDKTCAVLPLLPLILFIFRKIIDFFLRFYFIPSFIFIIPDAIYTILTLATMAVAIYAITALIYRIVACEENDKVNFIEMITSLSALIASLLIKNGCSTLSISLFTLIGLVLAFDFVAKAILLNQPISDKLDFAADFNLYKTKLSEFKAELKKQKELEALAEAERKKFVEENRIPYVTKGASKFDGTGGELFVKGIILTIVSLVSCGLLTPFYLVEIIKWRKEHTVIEGNRMTFNGTGVQLWGLWIKWWFLSLITCGIYSYFATVDFFKWMNKHTSFEGDTPFNGIYELSYFDGNSFEYLGYAILTNLITCITCGIAYPWMFVKLSEWQTKNTVVQGRRLKLDAKGADYFGVWIVNQLLTIITCGIYYSWASCKEETFIVSHISSYEEPIR